MINRVIEIVRDASKLIVNKDFSIQCKGDICNNVTSADLAVEKYLNKNLLQLIDNSSFIGEESDKKEYNKEYLWIVDPIDGTANFIRDIGYSAISVALVKGDEVISGVVYNPYRDEMFYAEKGKGAYLNNSRISVSDRDLSHSFFCTAMSLYKKEYAKPCLNIMEKVYEKCEDIRRIGSAALELVYLACGRVDIFFEMRVFPWDFAAGEIIVKEAGGYVGTIGFDKTVFDRPIPLYCANSEENFKYLKKVVYDEIPVIPYSD